VHINAGSELILRQLFDRLGQSVHLLTPTYRCRPWIAKRRPVVPGRRRCLQHPPIGVCGNSFLPPSSHLWQGCYDPLLGRSDRTQDGQGIKNLS